MPFFLYLSEERSLEENFYLFPMSGVEYDRCLICRHAYFSTIIAQDSQVK